MDLSIQLETINGNSLLMYIITSLNFLLASPYRKHYRDHETLPQISATGNRPKSLR